MSPTFLAKAATNCTYQQFRLSVSRVAAYFVEEGCNYDPYRQPLISVTFNVQETFMRAYYQRKSTSSKETFLEAERDDK